MPTKKGPGFEGADILRNGHRSTAKNIAKATERLRMQEKPFWRAKNTLYHLTETIGGMENQRDHNE